MKNPFSVLKTAKKTKKNVFLLFLSLIFYTINASIKVALLEGISQNSCINLFFDMFGTLFASSEAKLKYFTEDNFLVLFHTSLWVRIVPKLLKEINYE
jgi:hypothetical protein